MNSGLRSVFLPGRVLVALFCMAALLAAASSAQETSPGSRVRALNNKLLQEFARLQSSPPAGAGGIREQAEVLIDQRNSALSSLIEQNPQEALRLAFPSDLLSDLASAFPAARSRLESHGRWEGPIEYIIEDAADFKSHRNIRAMSVGKETLFIQFTGAEPTGLKNGDVIRVEGIRAGNQVAADNATIQQTANGRPPRGLTCSTVGPQKSIVLLVTMPGAPASSTVTRTGVWDAFFHVTGTGDPLLSLTNFWHENSYGLTTAVGDVANGPNGGWYTLDNVYTEDQRAEIRAAAIRAADADVDFTQYTRLFIVINGMTVLSNGAGWGTIGCGSLASADGTFNASTAWLRATSFPDNDNLRAVHLAAHEAGHNLGLQHSNSRDYDAESLGAPGAAGLVDEYNDSFANMGRSFGHYSAPHKVKLGWLASGVQTVTTSGTYTIQPLEVGGSVQALKIRRGTDNANWIWVEYRQPIGVYDTKLSAPFVYGLGPNQIPYLDSSVSHIFSGGLIHYEDATTGAYSQLLDLTPQSFTTNTSSLVPDDWLDPVLVGSWLDPYTGLSLTASNPTGNSLTVSVVYGTAPCAAANPTVTMSPLNPSAKRGQSVSYTVAVTNNDTLACAGKTFSLSSSLPAGWVTSFAPASLTIPALSTATVSMTKTVPVDAVLATYATDATAASGVYSGTASANVTVKAGK